uniref:Uncharacterized protein AlNc14C51G3997 n=1 Tax=Albugo laibachii Nc14 TaxID=890382 RepID=F0WBF0_9STRA|nr:conserved hypothetical protein [Albugo laibachii Nc14]|eukprot:CCA18474.1 conserved hypothetical protein [Albugo laibachii Nc14]
MACNQMPLEIQQQLRILPGNNKCVDCDAPYPQWATVSYGTFLCLECSGRHRGLGVHISFVRSVTMDSWTDSQIKQMLMGGNEAFQRAFYGSGVPKTLCVQEKYNTPQAEAYRKQLCSRVEGKNPVALPHWDASCVKASNHTSTGRQGNADEKGIEALNGETNENYVARQTRLRDEARARMQSKFGPGGLQGIGSNGEKQEQHGNGGLGDITSAFSFLTTTVSSVATSAATLVVDQNLGSKVSSGWSFVQNTLNDPNLSENVKTGASASWSALSTATNSVWRTARGAVGSPSNQNTISRFEAGNEYPSRDSFGMESKSTTKQNDSATTVSGVDSSRSNGLSLSQETMHQRISLSPQKSHSTKPESVAKRKAINFFGEYGF